MKKDPFEKRGPDDAPKHIKEWHDRNVWAYGYNDAMKSLAKLVPNSRRFGKSLKIGNRQHTVKADRFAAFILTANPKSEIWCDFTGYVRQATLEVQGVGNNTKPVVILKGRK